MNPKDGQSRWPYSGFSRIKEANLESVEQHVCMRIPRDAFRQSGMCFNEIRQSSQAARYWEMMLQLFLEMCCEVYERPKEDGAIASKIRDINPFQKVYLEWIPSENDPQRACEYRLHAFIFTDVLTYGDHLNRLLEDNIRLRAEGAKRPGNSRKPDPLCALSDHQHYKRVTKEVYYRTICGLANGHRLVENNLDEVLSHNASLEDPCNMANPVNIWTVKNACTNCRNSDYRTRSDNYVNGVFTFRDTKRVIRLSPEQCCSKTFCSKYLPDYQSYVDKFVKPTKHVALPEDCTMLNDHENGHKDKAERPDDNRLDMMTLGEYDMRTVSEQEAERIEAFSSRSDFQNLSEAARDMYIANCQEFEGKPEFCKNYFMYQQWAMKELKSRCINPDANISEKGKVMVRWAASRNPPEYKSLWKFDPSLSLFANRVVKIMEEAEQIYLISTAHREFYQVMHARYDAYRRDMGLHLNIFQTGEGATSKSFIFDLMKRASVPLTIDQLTYETAKSNAVDGNRNDTITVCHEAPPGMFRTGKLKNMDNGQEAAFKERLTSNHVSCKTFYMDEASGKRSQRITKSECIGVWMGATNDDPDDVEEALKTRFYWGNFEKVKRPNKDIDDCINGERALSRDDKLRRVAINLEWQEEQYRVYLIEKMIWCGQIKDVEMDAFYILKQRFKNEYHGESVREAETRDWERVYIFARIQAICTALAAVFQVEGGEYYGQPFDEDQLLAVEAYLVVTQEMVFFTLTLMDGQFVHPAEHKILNKLFHLYKNKKSGTRFGIPRPEDESNKISYDYVKLAGGLQSNAKMLQNELTAAEGKTSLHNIQAFLTALSRMAITTHTYDAPPETAEGQPLAWPVPRKHQGKQKAQCAYISTEAVYIHVALLLKHSGKLHDPVLDTIESIRHQHQKAKRMMVARFWVSPEGKKDYHAFRIIEKLPKKGAVIKFGNVLHNSNASKLILGMARDDPSRNRKEVDINMDIDDWGRHKREIALGRPIRDVEERGINSAVPPLNYPSALNPVSVEQSFAAAAKRNDEAGSSSKRKREQVDSAVGSKLLRTA
jgi:hypothetical protein